jgi:alkanesulfonate monooxygenase SsuD/methylene tetrahydromethanopterin reductase-like flavin-dependent oxidoreductase (luciferase family)
MRFGISIPPFVDPSVVVDLAVDADANGWDAVLLWDHLQFMKGADIDVHDPWVLLGAIAARTKKIMLGTGVTPLARRRPHIVAKHLVTLDHLSGGRALLGVGLGEPPDADFSDLGDPADAKERAVLLDDALDVIAALITGDPVSHQGPRFSIDATFKPASVQQPRPPIFVAAVVPHQRPLRRAARWDGVFPIGADSYLSPGDIAEYLKGIERPPGWDVWAGLTPDHSVADFEEAGVTWLLDAPWPMGDWVAELRERIRKGPPT